MGMRVQCVALHIRPCREQQETSASSIMSTCYMSLTDELFIRHIDDGYATLCDLIVVDTLDSQTREEIKMYKSLSQPSLERVLVRF